MTDLLIGIIIAISTGLLGGMIYLIYLPFKKRLIRSGQLTDKLNQKIRWMFLVSICFISFALYKLLNYRTSSQERLEKRAFITLPPDFEVLKDEFQDMWQDYTLLYDIQLSNRSASHLRQVIRKSKFYNSRYFYNGTFSEDAYIVADSVKAVWCKSPKGFMFFRQEKNTGCQISLDTVTNIMKYMEYTF
jgi:hypothetical protein